MSTRARAEKGRFVTGSTEFDIIPQKWRQEWVTHQVHTKDGKTETNASFRTLCWVPVKDPETTDASAKAPDHDTDDRALLSVPAAESAPSAAPTAPESA
ncbi:hypothetical protein PMAC_000636 [Pneumocystis sp. 'macacae']|nr:hypothetical protein PMAC_000636 [Pneumocystis sp. 'macacae']